jgi:hypothetical protein
LSQKLSEREKEMQQLREATIKHEATVQTLNNQIHSLQKQLLESERKVPGAVAALFWWSVIWVVDRGLSLQGQRGVLRPAAEGAATGEGISREAELVIAGLREELSQVRCSIALKLTRAHTHTHNVALTLYLQEREHLAHYRVIADDREKAMKELQEVRCFQGLEGKKKTK